MNALFEAAKEVCEFMAARRWEFCVIGGLAVQRWGEPRTTMDADLTLFADWGDEETYAAAILERFQSRIPDALKFALDNRVLLIRASNGKDVDIGLGALPLEAEMIERAIPVEFAPGVVLPCCSAEDLFIMKAFANRPRDWVDAAGIIERQAALDKDRILANLAELCEYKESAGILERARSLLGEKP